MVRACIIFLCVYSVAWANDIYVSQTVEQNQDNKPAFIESPNSNSFEKDLTPPTDNSQFCSVIAGCQ
jgi:hypothetical protein